MKLSVRQRERVGVRVGTRASMVVRVKVRSRSMALKIYLTVIVDVLGSI